MLRSWLASRNNNSALQIAVSCCRGRQPAELAGTYPVCLAGSPFSQTTWLSSAPPSPHASHSWSVMNRGRGAGISATVGATRGMSFAAAADRR